MSLPFVKVEGAGNDLILLDLRGGAMLEDIPALALRLCDRHTGIGGDGLLVISDSGGLPLLRMFNPDGTEDFCGNALRCTAAFLHHRGEAQEANMLILTPRGRHRATVRRGLHLNYTVDVEIVAPEFSPAKVPVALALPQVLNYPLRVESHTVSISCVGIGTTHTVIFVDSDIDDVLFFELSPALENHPIFPERTSVLWCRAVNRTRVHMRIWERGAGETFACGTGACAAVVIGRSLGILDNTADVVTRGGVMSASWTGDGPVRLEGPARIVYTGYVW